MSEKSGAGRKPNELPEENGPVQRFAAALRALRKAAGDPTYRVLAGQAGYGVTSLSQAAAGKQLPTREVALAYVTVCGGDVNEWERYWQETWLQVAAKPPEEEAPPPYRGLFRFEPDDAGLFFGRAELVERLVELNLTQRLTAVFGPSGSGKSSLLRAGLIPRLRSASESGSGEEGATALGALRILTPGADPLTTHADRLLPDPDREADTWLIVDQFEELYTLGVDPADRDTFIDRLVAATKADSRLRVVIAVRADFLGRCAEHSELIAALQGATLLVGPMSRTELRQAIVRPAAADGLIVERALTERLLDEVADAPGGLPLMSHALLATWQRSSRRGLTIASYDAAGGLHGAVVHTAEEVYGELTAPQRELARGILLRLVNPGDGTPDTRRPTEPAELDFGDSDDTRAVLERLVRARLITFDDGTVDLAHEALISAWPRLRDWLDDERDRLRVHRSLSEAARTWQLLGREKDALYAGSRLDAAEEAFPPDRPRPTEDVRAERSAGADMCGDGGDTGDVRDSGHVGAGVDGDGAGDGDDRPADGREGPGGSSAPVPRNHGVDELTPTERQFLSASLRRRRRAARLRRTVVAALTAMVLLATGTAMVALQARSTARAERDDAVFGRLTAEADDLRDTRAGVAARLDVAAQRMRPDPELRARLASDAGRVLPTRLTGHRDLVSSVAHAPDGRTLASGGDDGTVRLWDTGHAAGAGGGSADSRKPLVKPLKLGDGPVGAVAFPARNGELLVAAGTGGTIRLWDTSERKRPRALGDPLVSHEEQHIVSLALAPDGGGLATAGDDGTVRLWDLSEPSDPTPVGEPVKADDSATGSVRDVAFSPDGKTLATAGYDKTVRMWRIDDEGLAPLGKPKHEHTAPVWTVAFSPDGETLASAGYDRSVRLWDTSDPSDLRPMGEPLTEHSAPVLSVSFSPDGRTLASAGEDDAPILWNVANPEYPQQLGV